MIGKLFGKKQSAAKPTPPAQSSNQQSAKASQASPSSSAAAGKQKPRKRSSHNRQRKAPVVSSWSLDQFQVPEAEGKTRFHDLGLDDRLLHAIADLGFEYCSPIQAASLPSTLRGNDVIGKAQTGTGKTAAFLITIITDLLKNPIAEQRYSGEPRAVIIAPTRELVVQIGEDAKNLTKYTDLKVATLIGGMDYQKQLHQIQNSLVDIVVASPGRLLDFQSRRDLFLDQVEIMVIDEADRMLDMGFIPQVRRIVKSTPRKEDRQTLLFSATFTQDVLNLTEQWTYKPFTVEIEPESVATDTVDQKVYIVATDDKIKLLNNIIKQPDSKSVIVFANRRDQTRRLYESLRKSGFRCGILSGEIPQNKRSATLKKFKEGQLQVLVATDVAGRGIHVDGISHVVNFTLPEDPEDYVHRIGRTGRAGAKGTSISFACEDDAFLLGPLEELLGNKLNCEQPPLELLA